MKDLSRKTFFEWEYDIHAKGIEIIETHHNNDHSQVLFFLSNRQVYGIGQGYVGSRAELSLDYISLVFDYARGIEASKNSWLHVNDDGIVYRHASWISGFAPAGSQGPVTKKAVFLQDGRLKRNDDGKLIFV